MPSPSALRTFEAAARLGSFKAAAIELSVTPTAISHQIRLLETHLGIPLFIRHTRAIELTEHGRQLSHDIHLAFHRIVQSLEAISATETVLTVSTTPAFAALWLVSKLGRFQERHPGFRIHLVTSTVPSDLERDRQIDIAIRYGLGPYPRLHAVPIANETFGAYGTPGYLRQMGKWQNVRLIETAWQQSGYEDLSWRTWVAAAGLSMTAANPQRFDQEHHVVQAGLASQGLVLASSLLVADPVRQGWLVPYRPDVHIAGMRYHALCLPDRASLRKISHFLEWLQREVASDTVFLQSHT